MAFFSSLIPKTTCRNCRSLWETTCMDKCDGESRWQFKHSISDFYTTGVLQHCLFCHFIFHTFEQVSTTARHECSSDMWKYIIAYVILDCRPSRIKYRQVGLYIVFRPAEAALASFKSPWWKQNSFHVQQSEHSELPSPWSWLYTWMPSAQGIDATSTKISEWMSTCLETHHPKLYPKLCRPVQQFTPTRLICVGENNDNIRLVEPKGCTLEYTALSYVWGGDHGCQTYKANYGSRLVKLMFDEIPKSLAEAIELTRMIGINHIWIDVLCILQDDSNDLIGELGVMHKIYHNAQLVISAANARTANEGCLRVPVAPLTIHFPNGYGELSSKSVLLTPDPLILHGPISVPVSAMKTEHFLGVVDSNWPSFTRAWCLQERLLASRVVHIAPYEMIFECNWRTYCECGMLQQGRFAGIKSCVDASLRPGWNGEPESQLYQVKLTAWRFVAAHASAGKLTKENDRLPSISGIARQLASPEMGRYLAGNWEAGLLESLGWHSVPDIKHKRPTSYIAPSWSWASISGEISMPLWADSRAPDLLALHNSVTINHVSCQPKIHGNDYGEITQGSLKVTGLASSMVTKSHEEPVRLLTIDAKLTLRMKLYFDVNEECADGSFAEVGAGTEVQLLLLWATVSAHYPKVAAALMLKPSSKTTYQRVGLVQVTALEDNLDEASKVEMDKVVEWLATTWKTKTFTVE